MNPKRFQFNLPKSRRPINASINEEWYPGIRTYWENASSRRIYNPISGIRTLVIHATAGSSSEGAVSVMKAGRASFHWLVPDENEAQHEQFVWACVPESLAAWHVRNDKSHPDVWQGKNKINHHSLGIELVNTQSPTDEFSDWQIEITAKIVRYCWAKYPNLKHVVSHAKLDPERRTDPGSNFPWRWFRELVLTGREGSFDELISQATDAAQIPSSRSRENCCA